MKVCGNVKQGPGRPDLRAGQHALVGVRQRHDEFATCGPGVQRSGQQRGHRAQFSVEAQFTIEFGRLERLRRNLAACRENAECDSQVESPTRLAHVRRRKAYRDAFLGPAKVRADQRAADPVFAFAHSRLGHADDGERRQAAGQKDLDSDRRGIRAELGPAVNNRK